MDKQQIMGHLRDMLHRQFQIEKTSVNLETRQQDIGIDSILMVDLMLDIENELGFSFDMMDLPKNPSMDDICNLILRNLK